MATQPEIGPPETDTRDEKVSTRQGLGYVVMGAGVLLPALAYVQHGASLFGQDALLKYLAIVVLSSAAGGALFAKPKRTVAGCLCGMLSGIGAAIALPLYVILLKRDSIHKIELVLVMVAGAMPGLFLSAWLAERAERAERLRNHPQP